MEELPKLSSKALLALHAKIADELCARGITRTANNPTGDLAEHLFCTKKTLRPSMHWSSCQLRSTLVLFLFFRSISNALARYKMCPPPGTLRSGPAVISCRRRYH